MQARCLLFLVIICLFSPLYGQVNPLTAVLPFKSQNVSESDTRIIKNLFETALVKTNVFKVIEQDEIDAILETQALTLTGNTDESLAVEIGKILSAKQIILGNFSKLGSMYLITVKLIDVESGENLRADKIQGSDLVDMGELAEILAYKLAGLTYTQDGIQFIAKERSEFFIETEPPGAEIYINGVYKGKSPDLFQNIPITMVEVEAKKGLLFYHGILDFSTESKTIHLELKQSYGSLYIKSPVTDLNVLINERNLGQLGNGFFENVPAGRHRLILESNEFYWEDIIEITSEQSTVLTVDPEPIGTLNIRTPSDSSIYLYNDTYSYEFLQNNSQMIRIWADTYHLKILHQDYKPYETEITIDKGEIFTLSPELTETAEKKLSYIYPILENKQDELEQLEYKYTSINESIRRNNRNSTILKIFSGIGIATAGTAYYLHLNTYEQYQNANLSSEAVDLRKQSELFRYTSIGAGLFAGTSGVLGLLPNRGQKKQRDKIREEIIELRKYLSHLKETITTLEAEL